MRRLRLLRQHGFSAVELLVVVTVIGAIVAVSMALVRRQPDSVGSSVSDTEQSSMTALEGLEKQINDKHNYLAADVSDWVAQMGMGAALKTDDYKFRINSQSFPTLYVSYRESAAPDSPPIPQVINPLVEQAMQTAGYDRTAGSYEFPGTDPAPTYVSYTSGDTTCLYMTAAGGQGAAVSCFTKNQVDLNAKQATSFIEKYLDANPQVVASELTFGPLTVKSQTKSGVIGASETAGYDIAEVLIVVNSKKQVALYYSNQNGPWTYIAQADDEYGFRCGAYTANDDIRRAMKGQVCLSQTGHVRLDSTRPALQ